MARSKDWKDALLSSGLPLEYSAAEALRARNFRVTADYSYERRNELGQPTVFSVDILAALLAKTSLNLQLLIECKYRHDSVRWLFTPGTWDSFFPPSFAEVFVVLDHLCAKHEFATEGLESFAKDYSLATAGVELHPSEANPKAVQQALHQLSYAVPVRVAELLNQQAWVKDRGPAVIVPAVLTTAEIWLLRGRTSLADVRAANEVSDIADRKDLVILHRPPNPELRQYSRQLYDARLAVETKNALITALSPKFSFDSVLNYLSSNVPSLYLIVDYARLDLTLKNIATFFNASSRIRKRGVA